MITSVVRCTLRELFSLEKFYYFLFNDTRPLPPALPFSITACSISERTNTKKELEIIYNIYVVVVVFASSLCNGKWNKLTR